MARTPSNMISLGSEAPDFNLPDVNSETNISLKEYKGKIGTVIMFICNHCPYVKAIIRELAKDCNEDKVYEFFFCAPPLPITKAVGSPINPMAIK